MNFHIFFCSWIIRSWFFLFTWRITIILITSIINGLAWFSKNLWSKRTLTSKANGTAMQTFHCSFNMFSVSVPFCRKECGSFSQSRSLFIIVPQVINALPSQHEQKEPRIYGDVVPGIKKLPDNRDYNRFFCENMSVPSGPTFHQ